VKNIITTITTLAIVTSFFSLHSAEESTYHILKVNDLENVNLFSQMNELVVLDNNCDRIRDDNQFFTQQNLALRSF